MATQNLNDGETIPDFSWMAPEVIISSVVDALIGALTNGGEQSLEVIFNQNPIFDTNFGSCEKFETFMQAFVSKHTKMFALLEINNEDGTCTTWLKITESESDSDKEDNIDAPKKRQRRAWLSAA